jgi:hypothetical protein
MWIVPAKFVTCNLRNGWRAAVKLEISPFGEKLSGEYIIGTPQISYLTLGNVFATLCANQ